MITSVSYLKTSVNSSRPVKLRVSVIADIISYLQVEVIQTLLKK